MSAILRLAALSLSVLLLVASCGQKGPLRMPEESGAVADARTATAALPART